MSPRLSTIYRKVEIVINDSITTHRITTIDALRGFALFGILYAHMIFWYSGGVLPEHVYRDNTGLGSGIAIGVLFVLVMGKFFSMFSFLFGLSFYIQMQSLTKRGYNVALRFGWRLFILGIIGLIHHALWRADILSIYVPLGFVLIFARNLSNTAPIAIGFLLILNIPTKIYELGSLLIAGKFHITGYSQAAMADRYFEVMSSAPFMEMMIDNIKALPAKFDYQITTGRLIITFGFFLLGMFAGRMQWFEKLEENHELVKKLWKRSWQALALTFCAGLLLVGAVFALSIKTDDYQWLQWLAGIKTDNYQWLQWLAGFYADFSNAFLTLFYITGFTLLMYKPHWKKCLAPLADAGKMALSTYLLQTFFGLMIFYSFGLGLFAKTSPALNCLMCFGIFAVQLLICRIWLNYFNYGPLEWSWRSATFFKWQPFLKNKNGLRSWRWPPPSAWPKPNKSATRGDKG